MSVTFISYRPGDADYTTHTLHTLEGASQSGQTQVVEVITINGVTYAMVIDANTSSTNGLNGWTPVLALHVDGDRTLARVTDWTGGGGTKPAAGMFLGASGFVADMAQAISVRGPKGDAGDIAQLADGSIGKAKLSNGVQASLNKADAAISDLAGVVTAVANGPADKLAELQGLVSGAAKYDPVTWPMRVPAVLASPPTITPGTNGAASAISGSIHVRSADSSAFAYFGGPISRGTNYPDYLGVRLGKWIGTTSPSCCAVEFWLDTADATGRFEVYSKGVTGGYRVLLGQGDGSWAAFTAGATRTLPNDGGMYRDLVALGAAGEYRIRLEYTGGVLFFGVQVGATDTVRPTRSLKRLIVIGDSFSEPTINDSGSSFAPADGWPQQLAYLSGYDIWTCAKGGSGYVETPANQGNKFRKRLAEALTYSGDIMFAGGINDAGESLTEFAAEAGGCFDDVVAAGRRLIVLSPFWPKGITGYPTYLLQYRDTLKSLCEARGGTFIDLINLGIPEPLLAYAAWSGQITTAVTSGATSLVVDSRPSYFDEAGVAKDQWFVKVGSGDYQVVRQVSNITGSGPYTLSLVGTMPGALPVGTPVAMAGPGYLTGTGKQGSAVGDGNSDRYTGPDGTHPTRLGHHNIPRIVLRQWSRLLSAT